MNMSKNSCLTLAGDILFKIIKSDCNFGKEGMI